MLNSIKKEDDVIFRFLLMGSHFALVINEAIVANDEEITSSISIEVECKGSCVSCFDCIKDFCIYCYFFPPYINQPKLSLVVIGNEDRWSFHCAVVS